MSVKKIHTVIIDDESRALNRMKILLNHFDAIKIIGQITNPQDGCDFIINNKPDLVFLDVEMPGKTSLEIADEIRKNLLLTKMVFVTNCL